MKDNTIKEKVHLSTIDLDSYIKNIPLLIETPIKGKDYIGYGCDNTYPQYLLKLYDECADHQTIIDGCVNYVMGNGLTIVDQNLLKFSEKVNKDGETLSDVMRKCELDFQIFGGFAINLITDKLGTLLEMYYMDFNTLRINDECSTIYYSKEWGKWGAKGLEVPSFDATKEQTNSIFYYRGKKTRGVYPTPLYNAALKAIQTSIKISDFHLNNITTGFNANVLVNFFNGSPTPEVQKKIEKDMKAKFSGVDGDKLLVTFNDSKEREVTITRLDDDNLDEKFNTLFKNTQNTIFTSHKVTSPQLFGVKAENQGFSKTEFVEAFEIYNSTVIAPLQTDLTSEFGKILSKFFINSKIEIIPFSLNTIQTA